MGVKKIKSQKLKVKNLEFYFFAVAAFGEGLSGGDRIFIELAKRFARWGHKVNIWVWREGFQMCQRQHLENSNIKYWILNMHPWCRLGFVACYFARIVKAVIEAFKLVISHQSSLVVYSASEFWMDSFPSLILKLRYPEVTWAAAWYQTAPNPLKGFKEGARKSGYQSSALLYWLAQLPIKPLIKRYADFVLVNNEEEKKQFPKLNKKGRAIVVLGAVNIGEIREWKRRRGKRKGETRKIYDAVFQGRFHPQKGVMELIDIWKRVVDKKPGAKLAMIGNGPLMEKVRGKVERERMEKNMKLFGYVFDGPKKYRIFSQSKLVVHPAFYDSGGMASAEAMAFGLPCVGFNLKAYESYYPYGMVKVKTGDLQAFTEKIIRLLGDQGYREKVGKEALKMIEKRWSWDKRAQEVLEVIKTYVKNS